MLCHLTVGANDMNESRKFYDATFEALGYEPGRIEGRWLIYQGPSFVFAVNEPLDGKAATHANGGTIGFSASSVEQVDKWHAAGLFAGGTSCEDPPGIRENDGNPAYIAYLRDPVGNKLCAKYPLAGR